MNTQSKQSNPHVWAFWAGVLGLVVSYGHLPAPWTGDGIRINLIEIIVQTGGFALLGAGAAWWRNRGTP